MRQANEFSYINQNRAWNSPHALIPRDHPMERGRRGWDQHVTPQKAVRLSDDIVMTAP